MPCSNAMQKKGKPDEREDDLPRLPGNGTGRSFTPINLPALSWWPNAPAGPGGS